MNEEASNDTKEVPKVKITSMNNLILDDLVSSSKIPKLKITSANHKKRKSISFFEATKELN